MCNDLNRARKKELVEVEVEAFLPMKMVFCWLQESIVLLGRPPGQCKLY
jgi:hypothetical protein